MAGSNDLKSIVLDADGIERSITRIAHQILEKNNGAGNIALVGIVTRGDLLAKRLHEKIEEIELVADVSVSCEELKRCDLVIRIKIHGLCRDHVEEI